MRDLFDIIQEAEMTCESFSDPHIYQAWKTLQKHGISWEKAMHWNRSYIQWDKLSEEDVIEVSKSDFKKEFTNMRRMHRGTADRPFLVFGFKAENLYCMFEPETGMLGMLTTATYVDSVIWYRQGTTGKDYHLKVSEMYDIMDSCDYLVKIYVDKASAKQIRDDRARSQADMFPDLDSNDRKSRHLTQGVLGYNTGGRSDYVDHDSFYGYCETLARRARDAWKKIIAENKFKRSSDTSEIDNAVQEVVNLMMKLSMWATKNPDKISEFELEHIMKMVYDQYSSYSNGRRTYKTADNEILVCYQRYCAACMRLQKGDPSNDPRTDLESRDRLHDIILSKCADFKKKISKLQYPHLID